MHDSPSRSTRAASLALLAAAVLLAFAPLFDAGWLLFDDPVYVLKNPHVNRGLGWESARWALTAVHGGNWHPLTSLSHLVDVELFGLEPRGPHLENLLLHTANALLLAWLCFRCTAAWWTSLLVAALWALHPLRVESVAWISERKDVLSTCFFLLTLLAWLRWTERPGRGRYALALGLYALGLLAKPMLVTLPCVLLLLDRWPLARVPEGRTVRARWSGLVREKLPFLALSVVICVSTFLAQREAGALMGADNMDAGERVQNALASVAVYLGQTVWPADLAVFYPWQRSAQAWPALLFALVLGASLWAAWRLRDRLPSLTTGWLWYLGTLVPVIGLVQVGGQAHADRYTLLPAIGLLWGLLFAIRSLVQPHPAASRALFALGLLVCFPLARATRAQAALWIDTRTLFAHALEVTHDNALAHQTLGNALLVAGERSAAIAHLTEALRLVPDFPDAHNNLGSALGAENDFEGAIVHFRAALRTQDTAEAHHNLGFALARLGRIDEAIPEYERALVLEPLHALSHVKLGIALGAKGRLEEAAAHLRAGLELLPDEIEARRWLAVTYTLQGKVEAAIVEYRQLLQRSPKDLDALNNIAWIRATHSEPAHRDGAEAVRLAELARASAPAENSVLCSTLAAAYGEAGRFEDAVNTAERAVALARAENDAESAQRFTVQLECYRARRPFHLP